MSEQFENLTMESAKQIVEQRLAALQALQPLISHGFYQRALKKLQAEQQQFELLLNETALRQKELARFTFVLHSGYFEQKLWKA